MSLFHAFNMFLRAVLLILMAAISFGQILPEALQKTSQFSQRCLAFPAKAPSGLRVKGE
ncbi:MAG: hypothetical protein ACJ8G3_12505 [Burkholderiaceae bacterium]